MIEATPISAINFIVIIIIISIMEHAFIQLFRNNRTRRASGDAAWRHRSAAEDTFTHTYTPNDYMPSDDEVMQVLGNQGAVIFY